MPDMEKVINKVTAIVADMQEEVDEWKYYSDSELRVGLTCDCDWWYKTLQTLNDALALLKAQEPTIAAIPLSWQTEQEYGGDEELSVAANTVVKAWLTREQEAQK